MSNKKKYISLSCCLLAAIALIGVIALMFISHSRQDNTLKYNQSLESRLASKAALLLEANRKLKESHNSIALLKVENDSLVLIKQTLSLRSDSLLLLNNSYTDKINELEKLLYEDTLVINMPVSEHYELFLMWTKPD